MKQAGRLRSQAPRHIDRVRAGRLRSQACGDVDRDADYCVRAVGSKRDACVPRSVYLLVLYGPPAVDMVAIIAAFFMICCPSL
jgi:hypothetical protein